MLMNFSLRLNLDDWLYSRSHAPIEITVMSDDSVLAECKREQEREILLLFSFSSLCSAKRKMKKRKRTIARSLV